MERLLKGYILSRRASQFQSVCLLTSFSFNCCYFSFIFRKRKGCERRRNIEAAFCQQLAAQHANRRFPAIFRPRNHKSTTPSPLCSEKMSSFHESRSYFFAGRDISEEVKVFSFFSALKCLASSNVSGWLVFIRLLTVWEGEFVRLCESLRYHWVTICFTKEKLQLEKVHTYSGSQVSLSDSCLLSKYRPAV